MESESTEQQKKAWESEQRRKYHEGLLTVRRIKALEAFPGWTWQANVAQYADNLRRQNGSRRNESTA
jgi:hypothetical protein